VAHVSGIFNRLHHVCIVVRDLEKSVAFYESIGVGPWYDYPKAGAYLEFEVPNLAASQATRYKCADLANFQLQLCQPAGGDSPQQRFLDRNGEGVYHLGFEVEERTAAEAAGRALGLGVIARGARADGSGFCYFDTQDRAGTVLEIRKSPASQKRTQRT
jgi:catechol 2,3-dioxygenase-like lactoylglutathione lyase family enzyme